MSTESNTTKGNRTYRDQRADQAVVEAILKKESKWTRFWRGMKRTKYLHMLMIPGLLYYIIFQYLPLYGIIIAFKDFRLMAGQSFIESILTSDWVGFRHFVDFFNGPNFIKLLKNTFLLSFYSILWGFPAPILLAVLLNEVRQMWYKRFVQTVSYLPHFISVVAIVGLFKMMFSPDSGIVNTILVKLFGIDPIYFFGDPDWFRTLFISSGIWQELGWGTIIYLAAIARVDEEQHESAVIDGATRVQRIWHITMPAMKPTIIILMIMQLGGLLSMGIQKVILMYSPMTYETADIVGTYVFRRGLIQQDYSFATAVGLFDAMVALVLITMANYVSRWVTKESLW